MNTADGTRGFGALLQRFRTAAGLSQEELAERAGLSRRGISDLKRGTRRRPYAETVRRLADALGLDEMAKAQLQATARGAADSVLHIESISEPARGWHSVPLPLTSFVGRERELESVRRLIGRSRLLTLVGTGGIGKTRLALELAHGLVDDYPDGVVLVELAALADPSLVDHAVAAALKIRYQGGRSVVDTLIKALRDRSVLVVLDNCEHLIGTCSDLVRALLTACPDLHILATSREPLRLAGEWRWRVPSLNVPDSLPRPTREHLEASEAVRLFVQRSQAVEPDFGGTERELQLVGEICQRLDGIPLAIELAAPLVSALSLEQIVDHLEDRFALLASGTREALPRHRTLRAMVDGSYDLLAESERRLFERRSVFAGGWTLGAAKRVCAVGDLRDQDVLPLLVRLVDQSLVSVEPGGTESRRYRLLETLRQYARDRLEERAEVIAGHELPAASFTGMSRRRHAVVFMEMAERLAPDLLGTRSADCSVQLDRERDNLRAALAWSLETSEAAEPPGTARESRIEVGLRIGTALAFYWDLRGAHAEGRRWLEALFASQQDVMAAPVSVCCAALSWATQAATTQGDLVSAARYASEAEALASTVEDPYAQALALMGLGATHYLIGDSDLAARNLEEALQLAHSSGHPFALGSVLYWSGEVAFRSGDRQRARELFEASLETCQAADLLWGAAYCLASLGGIALAEGDFLAAWRYEQQALALRRNLDDRRGIAWSLDRLACVAGLDGRAEHAARLFGASVTFHEDLGLPLAPVPEWRTWHDEAEAAARERLGAERYAAAWAAGRALVRTEAIALALASRHNAGQLT